ncbi:MAG TPA: MOSC domain-containing protein [Pseudothermotoga sp.]|nr:MOSC domain-containing protein [Pseudothermotoga sp.]HOK83857.1 MOSC domain-containing protein [Pseudothermotoga sp.]HPP70240.1 MOSC domain-containing protein [Pseudothermotoga sp.]
MSGNVNKFEARVVSVNISKVKGVRKTPVEEIELIANHGVKNDAHAGNWHRQVSILSVNSIEKARTWGIQVNFGDFAENITVEGVQVWKLPLGTKVFVNEAELEITQIGKECHDRCEIAKIVGRCVMPTEGIFLRVIKGGKVKAGDRIIFVTGK